MEGEIVTEARSQSTGGSFFSDCLALRGHLSHSKNVDHQSEAMDKSVERGLWLRSKGSEVKPGCWQGSAERK